MSALLFVPALAQSPTTHAATTAPENSMRRDQLDALDRKELGTRYDPAQAGNFYELHKLIERYFASPGDRKATLAAISDLNIDPNIVGRLTRIHMDWPALSPGCHFIHEGVGSREVKYYLGLPANYDRASAMPLVIRLPSASALPEDPKGDPEAIAKLYTGWITEELGRHPDALILMPVADPQEGFGPSYTGSNTVIQSLQSAMRQVNIDPARVALLGTETSAPAVWNLGLHYTNYFAAIAPFAGFANADWQRIRLMNLRNTHIITWHDAEDSKVKVDNTRQLTDILKRMKFDVDYEETHGSGHTPSAEVLARSYLKLFNPPRPLYPAEVSIQSNRPDTLFNRLDWVQMYQPSRPGPDHRLLFRRPGEFMTVYSYPMSIKAKFADNRIDADAENVESMRFYLNDQMIDFGKPFTLSVNNRIRFQGLLKPSLEEMLKDQLFLGRGWRYYTAVLDVDFGEPATKPTTQPLHPLVPGVRGEGRGEG